jgi:hypothetical protein
MVLKKQWIQHGLLELVRSAAPQDSKHLRSSEASTNLPMLASAQVLLTRLNSWTIRHEQPAGTPRVAGSHLPAAAVENQFPLPNR